MNVFVYDESLMTDVESPAYVINDIPAPMFFDANLVEDPDEADIIFFPKRFIIPSKRMSSHITAERRLRKIVSQADLWNERREDHVIIMYGDAYREIECLEGAQVFRPSVHKNSLQHVMPYYGHVVPKLLLPIEECKYEMCFQGALGTHKIRRKMHVALSNMDLEKEKIWYKNTAAYFSYIPIEQKKGLRKEYEQTIRDSKFVLCPRGNALSSFRYYDALRCGRIPILIADDTKLPLDGVIPYDKIHIRVPEDDIENFMDYVEDWKSKNNLVNSSRIAHAIATEWLMLRSFLRYVQTTLIEKWRIDDERKAKKLVTGNRVLFM